MCVWKDYNCDVDMNSAYLLVLIIFADAHFCFLRKLTNELLFRYFVAFLALPLARFRLICWSFLMVIEASLTIRQVRVNNEWNFDNSLSLIISSIDYIFLACTGDWPRYLLFDWFSNILCLLRSSQSSIFACWYRCWRLLGSKFACLNLLV
jgi:hypothetical protein